MKKLYGDDLMTTYVLGLLKSNQISNIVKQISKLWKPTICVMRMKMVAKMMLMTAMMEVVKMAKMKRTC